MYIILTLFQIGFNCSVMGKLQNLRLIHTVNVY